MLTISNYLFNSFLNLVSLETIFRKITFQMKEIINAAVFILEKELDIQSFLILILNKIFLGQIQISIQGLTSCCILFQLLLN